MTACALLADGEMRLLAGPPTGEAFRGLVRFCFIKKVGFGGNTRLVHKPSGGDLTMDQMFDAAQKVLGPEVDSLDVFTRRDGGFGYGQGVLDGPRLAQVIPFARREDRAAA